MGYLRDICLFIQNKAGNGCFRKTNFLKNIEFIIKLYNNTKRKLEVEFREGYAP